MSSSISSVSVAPWMVARAESRLSSSPPLCVRHCPLQRGTHWDAEGEHGPGAQEAQPQGMASWEGGVMQAQGGGGGGWKDRLPAVAPRSLSSHVFDAFAR